MPYRVPNDSERTYAAQAILDRADLGVLAAAIGGDGVVSGCEVSQQTVPNLTVVVAAGAVQIGGARATVVAGNVAITTADLSLDRIDAVQIDNTGIKSSKTGTPALKPVLPDPDANNVIVAEVYVAVGVAAITTAMITSRVVNTARVGVRANSTGSTFARRRINLIGGTNVTVTVADDPTNEEVDVTLDASAGSALTIQDEGVALATAAATINFVGTGVTATGTGATKTVTVTTASGSGLRTGILVCANDAPSWMKTNADYTCDAVNDEVQIQAAIDLAQTYVIGSAYGVPPVILSPGAFRLGAAITLKSAPLVGSSWPNLGTRIYWDGAAGTTVFTKSAAFTGAMSFWELSRIEFLKGTGNPLTWLDTSAASVDKNFRITESHFHDCTGPQIKVGSWVNLHWRDLRFDNWGTYGMLLAPASSQNLATFNLDGFTSDNEPATTGLALIGIDTSASASFNLGTFRLANGRSEYNSVLSAPSAVIHVIAPNPGSTRAIGIELENVTVDNVVALNPFYLVYLDTTATNLMVTLTLINVRKNGILTAVVGGSLSASFPTIPVQNGYGFVSVATGAVDIFAGKIAIGAGAPTITSGTGAPTASEPNGSIYLRTDGVAGTTIYVRAASAWSANA